MKRFVSGADRGQSTLLPDCLDDFIDESNPVRVIDAFADALDLSELGFDGLEPAVTGRPSYHPSTLLKLYIYGYLNRVQSSRRLEREAGRNVEVMWLLGRLVPDHKTIADFRKDNGAALRQVCARFVELCRRMGLLTTASVAIDGSKFKAVNNRDRNFTRGKVERRRARLEESVARYLSQLDTADREEPTEALAAKTARLKDKLAKLEEEMAKLAVYEQRMLASSDQQVSLTDPDSRSMATSGRGSGVVGYNVQVAVDTQHHLIVTHEVTNSGSDRAQLAAVAKEAKAVLQTDTDRLPTRVEEVPQLGLDLVKSGIKTIVWACGYRPDYSWLELPILDRKGYVAHDGGIVSAPGVYLMGMQFLRRRKSALIDGAGDDARDLGAHLAAYLDGTRRVGA